MHLLTNQTIREIEINLKLFLMKLRIQFFFFFLFLFKYEIEFYYLYSRMNLLYMKYTTTKKIVFELTTCLLALESFENVIRDQ